MSHVQPEQIPGSHLTIGIICKDGLPHIVDCLAALPAPDELEPALRLILVDCGSSDGTTKVMLDFSGSRPDVHMRRVEGTANPAVARNAILDVAPPGTLLLLDGDMVLENTFLGAALAHIREGRADAVTGSLREVHFGPDLTPVRGPFWRVPPVPTAPVRMSGGAIMLGHRVLSSGIRYDERLRYYEDMDFALRISRRHRLLRIPDSFGVHLTHPYFGPLRAGDYFRSGGSRSFGTLLRRNVGDPGALLALLSGHMGFVVGAAAQCMMLALLAAKRVDMALLALAALLFDLMRKVVRPAGGIVLELIQWVGTRIYDPWAILWGFMTTRGALPRYQIFDFVVPADGDWKGTEPETVPPAKRDMPMKPPAQLVKTPPSLRNARLSAGTRR